MFYVNNNYENVDNFNTQTFKSGGATFKALFYVPSDLIFQHSPVKGRTKKTETNRMRNADFIDTSTIVDTQEIVKVGGKVSKVYEGVFNKENFETSPLRTIIKTIFNSRSRYTNEDFDIMPRFVILLLRSYLGKVKEKIFQ